MEIKYAYNIGDKAIFANKIVTIEVCLNLNGVPAYEVSEIGGVPISETELTPFLNEVNGATSYNPSIIKKYMDNLKRQDQNLRQLSTYARNLNLLALENKLNPTYFRDKEVENVKTILLRRTKPNPLLIGSAGCGKTAIVEEIARSFVKEHLESGTTVPTIYDLSLNSLVSGAKYRGDFEERIKAILDVVSNNKNIIIFIDEIHSINHVGSADGATTAGQILKPALARGDIRCIGATTTEEYNKHIATDKALARRFSKVEIKSLIGDNRSKCVDNIIQEYGKYFDIDTSNIKTEDILNIVDNLMPDTTFPDNAIDIIDETLATAKYKNKTEITMTDINETVSKITGFLVISA